MSRPGGLGAPIPKPFTRQRILQMDASGVDNLVVVDRPTILEPYGDPDIDTQGITGWATSFRTWDEKDSPQLGVPAPRGTCYLPSEGRWLVRCKATESNGSGVGGRVYYREIDAMAWEQIQRSTQGAGYSQRQEAFQVGPIPTSGQFQVISCAASIEATRLDLWADSNQNLGVSAIWIGTGGRRTAVDVGTRVPPSTYADGFSDYVVRFEGANFPIGVVRSRSAGGFGTLNVNVWYRNLP